jgi:hypothetical protein
MGKHVTPRGRWRALVMTGVVVVGSMAGAGTALANWSDQNCHGSAFDMSAWKRSEARDYAQQADNEGYEWGGGCFKLNNRDDTPGAPDSGGEGTDCSGLVFKTWAMKTDGSVGFRYWDHDKEIHGPYSTDAFYTAGKSDPFKNISKGYGSTMNMDAFVYRTPADDGGHIGMIYSQGSGGADYIIESKGDTYGTGIFWEDYRSQSIYHGVRRENWTPECYPHCR